MQSQVSVALFAAGYSAFTADVFDDLDSGMEQQLNALKYHSCIVMEKPITASALKSQRKDMH